MLFVVFAMVVVACGDTSDDAADDVVEESSDTTAAPAQLLHLHKKSHLLHQMVYLS